MNSKAYKDLFTRIFSWKFFIVIFLFFCLAAAALVVGKFNRNTSHPGGCQCRKEFAKVAGLFKESPSPVELIPEKEWTVPDLVIIGAREEVIKGTRYDASYEVISYPGGDVSLDRGACTDIIIRAFRRAGIDLQQLIHEDMKENFHLYPQKWGLSGPDANIDHRRVPNQVCFLERHGISLALDVKDERDEWQWGDVVYWRFPGGRDHCGIISDRTGKDGLPLVIHNAGVAREEDCLLRWEITGHFRFPG